MPDSESGPWESHPRRVLRRLPSLRDPQVLGAVTGQKYQYGLTGSLQNRLPQPAFRTDGYRFAPYLAVFDRVENEKP